MCFMLCALRRKERSGGSGWGRKLAQECGVVPAAGGDGEQAVEDQAEQRVSEPAVLQAGDYGDAGFAFLTQGSGNMGLGQAGPDSQGPEQGEQFAETKHRKSINRFIPISKGSFRPILRRSDS